MISSLKFLIIFSIIFSPGIIWNFISIKYKHGRSSFPSDTMFIMQSILLTGITYLFESLLFLLFELFKLLFELLFDYKIPNPTFNFLLFIAIFLSIPIALCLSILDLYEGKYDLFKKLLDKLPYPITEKYGNEDVWDRILSSKENAWVSISDFENKIIYSGRLGYYSDTGKTRELSLEEVTVYNFKGKKLCSLPEMYISRPSESIIMEFLEETKGEDDEKK